MPTPTENLRDGIKSSADVLASLPIQLEAKIASLTSDLAAIRADRNAQLLIVNQLELKAEGLADQLAAAHERIAKLEGKPPVVTDPPVVVVGDTLIDLGSQPLASGKAYKLKPGPHFVSNLRVPSGVQLIGGAGVLVKAKSADAGNILFLGDNKDIRVDDITFEVPKNKIAILGNAVQDCSFRDLSLIDGSGTLLQIYNDPTAQPRKAAKAITIGGEFGGIGEKYIIFLEGVDGLHFDDLRITQGVTFEASLRTARFVSNVTGKVFVDGRPAWNLTHNADGTRKAGWAKDPSAVRFHDGGNWDLERLEVYGTLGIGPMGGGDGGQQVSDKRLRELALGSRLANFRVGTLIVEGMLSLNPGLVGARFETGRVVTKRPITSQDGILIDTQSHYPQDKFFQAGDVRRTAPEAVFGGPAGFAFTNENGDGDGIIRSRFPKITFVNATKNGKPLV